VKNLLSTADSFMIYEMEHLTIAFSGEPSQVED